MKHAPLVCRRALVLSAAAIFTSPPRAMRAADDDLRRAQQQLYNPLPEIQPFTSQVSDAIRIKTMRGVWRLREVDKAGRATEGWLTFRGSPLEERGKVSYEGGAAAGRGPWILKADGFGPNPEGKPGGIIEQKALWKLRRGSSGTFQYAGRLYVPSYTGDKPDASIEGSVVELINGGKPKGGSEKVVGKFEASLSRLLTAEDEGEGGASEAIQVVPVYDEQLVYRQRPAAEDPLDVR